MFEEIDINENPMVRVSILFVITNEFYILAKSMWWLPRSNARSYGL